MSVKTDGDSKTLYVDGTNGYVAIGEGTPIAELDIESTNKVGFNVQTNSTLTAPSVNNHGIYNTFTVKSAVNDTHNFKATTNIVDIDETGGTAGDVVRISNTVRLNSVAVATTYSNIFGVVTDLGRVSTNAAQTLTNYYGFYSKSSIAGSGAFDGTDWYHFYAEDFADYGGTVANIYGLWIEKKHMEQIIME